jgi:hypothetical protein
MLTLLTSPHGRGREIGPIGTASRIVAGSMAIVLPVALEGIGWWDLAALAAAPLVATVAARLVTAVFARVAPGALARRDALCSPAACALIGLLFAAAFALGTATTVYGDVVIWGFLGASMLLAAVRGDGGCEVLAFPNAITARHDRIGCILFAPIDRLEARHGADAGAAGPPVGPGVRSA